jgi:lipid II:glycine glycyltransferase (peptidoglycan interpeptide bridge formation enzyme)
VTPASSPSETTSPSLAVPALSAADAAWDAFVAGHPHGHVLQTARWARLKSAFGWRADRATLAGPDGAIIAGASLLFRRLPWGQTLAYAPKGPLVDWSDAAQAGALMERVRATCRKRHAALLKIEPELPDSPELAQVLSGLGFHPSAQRVQPLSTIHIDLAPDEAAILDRMKPKWRYNIRLAERKGVTVRQGELADLPAIQALLEHTGARDGFGVHSAEYYARATALFVPPGLAAWLLAETEGRLLAAIAVFALGPMAWYMWGASGDADRNLMPNHALQWAAMRWARAKGCTVYDLWGIPDEVGADPDAYADPERWGDDGLWGVYRFKQGFGGRVVRYTGAWDLPLSAPGHALYRAALKVRATAE